MSSDDQALSVSEGVDLVRLADDDPRRAVELAERLVEAEVLEPIEAYRALGLACRPIGEPSQSRRWLERGLEEAERRGDLVERDELRITYAATKAMLGDFDAALALLDTAEESNDPAVRQHARVQRAGMLARRGRVAEAMEIYRETEPSLRRRGDDAWLARLHSNRGVLLALTGDFAGAESNLREALGLYEAAGADLSSAEIRHNLSFVLTHRGELLDALESYAEAASAFAFLDIPNVELPLDRCEALMYAGLTDDALTIASEALEDVVRRGMAEETAEGLLKYARAADAAGSPGAGAAAERARDALEAIGNQALAAAATVIALRSRSRHAADRSILLAEADDIASQLEARDRRLPAGVARLLACRTALELGDIRAAVRQFSRAERRLGASDASVAPVPMSIGLELALTGGLLAEARGHDAEASRMGRRGLARVEGIASQIGLSGQQAYVLGCALDLIRLQIRLSLRRPGNARLFRWIEAGRTRFERTPRLRRSDDEAHATELEQLRWIHTERAAEPIDPGLAEEQAEAEQRVRTTVRKAAEKASGQTLTPTLATLRSTLDKSERYVSWFSPDPMLWELKVGPQGSQRRCVGSQAIVQDLADRLSLGIGGLAAQRPDAEAQVHAAGRALETILLPDVAPDRIVVNPPAEYFNLAWTALPALSDRSVVVTPSAAAYLRDRRPTDGDPSALVVAGPELARAPAEAEIVASHYSNLVYLQPSAATSERLLVGLTTARVAHFACHAIFRPDNPSFSYLRLHDGPLFLHDIELLQSGPETVILSACSGARSGAAGNQLHGFVTALLRAGARTVIASISPVPDTNETLGLVDRLHAGLQSGLPPARALSRARSYDDPLSTYTSHAFQCFGWG